MYPAPMTRSSSEFDLKRGDYPPRQRFAAGCIAAAQVDLVHVARLSGVVERQVTVAGPYLVLGLFALVVHRLVHVGDLAVRQIAAQRAVAHLPLHPLPGDQVLHFLAQATTGLFDAPDQRARIEARQCAA